MCSMLRRSLRQEKEETAMHGFYEGEAAVTAEFTLSPEDYAKARLLAERQLKPVTRPWVRAGMLITASLLF